MTDETRKTAQNNWFVEFKRAYADYPSQDNEGYVPDRGGFKTGFYAAWRFQESKIAEAVQAEREANADSVDTLAGYLRRTGGTDELTAIVKATAAAIRGQGK